MNKKNKLSEKRIKNTQIDKPMESPYSVVELLFDAYQYLERKARKKKLTCDLCVSETMPCRLCGEEEGLRKLLASLIDLSIEYTEEGNIVFGASTIVYDDGQLILRLSMADTGEGFEEEELPQKPELLEKLSALKAQVERLGGTIRITSVKHKGCFYWVKLPQKVHHAAPIGDIWEAIRRRQRKSSSLEEQAQPQTNPQPETEILPSALTTPAHGIDREIGLQFCLDEELYRVVLASYYEQGLEYQPKLLQFFEEKNWKEYTIIVHAIKSSSKNIGAMTLSEHALLQEQYGKAEAAEEIAKSFEAFAKEFDAILFEVKQMLS